MGIYLLSILHFDNDATCVCIVQVVSDPVGYGFVIRGSRPVYVHAVDPNGPASAAGLKVQYVYMCMCAHVHVY